MAKPQVWKDYPADHPMGSVVPKGGSDCAKCQYVRANGTQCAEPLFQKWNESKNLPAPADEYCCDRFTARTTRKTLGEQVRAQREKK